MDNADEFALLEINLDCAKEQLNETRAKNKLAQKYNKVDCTKPVTKRINQYKW